MDRCREVWARNMIKGKCRKKFRESMILDKCRKIWAQKPIYCMVYASDVSEMHDLKCRDMYGKRNFWICVWIHDFLRQTCSLTISWQE